MNRILYSNIFAVAYCRLCFFNNLLSCCFKTTERQITEQNNRTHLVERQQLLRRNRIHAAVVDKSDERRLATFLLLRTRSRLQHTRTRTHTHKHTLVDNHAYTQRCKLFFKAQAYAQTHTLVDTNAQKFVQA